MLPLLIHLHMFPYIKKTDRLVGHTTLDLASGRQTWVDLLCEASLVYKVSSRLAKATQQDPAYKRNV